MKYLFKITLILLLLCTPVYAAELRNDAALDGLTETKVVFDVNQGSPSRLLLRLEFIDKTYNQLIAFGTTPKVVVAFRGKASLYVTEGDDYLPSADLADKRKVEKWISQFKQQGMVLEQCALAAKMLKIDVEDFLPEIQVVANGYISLIGYQNKGYAFIPMD